MRLSTGTRLGTYEITGLLGTGGMGEVYRARDLRLGREVAVKVLPSDVASSRDRLSRFEREARMAAGLNHPNIVTLYSIEEDDGVPFITMELVEGQSLSTLVTPGGLPLPRLLELSIPLAEALAAAHERGVVHRDLKPGNAMVTCDGRVKVLDFGLAKAAAPAAPPQSEAPGVTAGAPISGEGLVLGTAPYMAPEQIRGGAVDARSDLFALGIILYELATGQRPFAGATPADVESAILRDMPAPARSLRRDLPRDLNRIIARCLEKEPRDRFQTARDVYNELRYAMREAGLGTAAAAQPAPAPVPARLQAAAGAPGTASPGETPSIAVLPFVNRSQSMEDEYFSEGLADELLNVLTKIRGLRVTARASSFQFKGRSEDLAVIGERLNVATLLDGSVRKSGNRVRISVQLVNAADRVQLWSEIYDRTLEDIFAVQDDIAHSVVKELRTALLGEEPDSRASGEVKAEVAKAAKGRGTDPEAHRLFLLARHLLDRCTREDSSRGIVHLKEALAMEPGFARAWTELGLAYATEAGRGWAPVTEGYERGREAVARALALEPDLAEAHAGMGWIRMHYDWDWPGAEASYARALEQAPGNPSVLRGAGALAAILGRLDEAIGLDRRVLEQDPLSATDHNQCGLAFQAADRLAEAEDAYRRALELAPQRVVTRASLALTLLAQGRCEEALAEARQEVDETFRLYPLAIVHHAMGHVVEANEALRKLTEMGADNAAYQIAEVHAVRGEVDAAFEWLERAYRQRDSGLIEVKTSSRLRSLHGDSRWGAFMKRMGFGGGAEEAM